jgi:hypothetical protein
VGLFLVPFTSSALARLTLAAIIAVPVLGFYGINFAAAKLDQATRAQCAAQDWPASQHAAHLAFCRTYLASN